MATSKGDIMLEACSNPEFPFYWWDSVFMGVVETLIDLHCDTMVIVSGLGLGVAAAVVASIPLWFVVKR